MNPLTQYSFCAAILGLSLGMTAPALAASNILYLNSVRGDGTGPPGDSLGNYRSAIANSIDNYGGGSIFDVDYIQTHVSGDLASLLNSKPAGYYNQIWFDTTIFNTVLLTPADLAALNSWAAYKQPQFILDSTFFFRNRRTPTIDTSAAILTSEQAVALRNVGGGIFIGTDNNNFAQTANQILTNFGFDGLFTGNSSPLTEDVTFTGNLAFKPKTLPLYQNFVDNHLLGLTTSSVPTGTHQLNQNGGNRTIQIREYLNSGQPHNISLIGASFDIRPPIVVTPVDDDYQTIPEPTSFIGLLVGAALGLVSFVKGKK